MNKKITVACVQVTAGPDMAENLARIEPLIRSAAAQGAQLITLPENTSLMVDDREKLFAQVGPEKTHRAVAFFSRLAHETKTWLLAGSLAIETDGERLANRSYLFDADGKIVARYDKIHMFDAALSENEVYKESARYRKGHQAILAKTPWGKVGLTICYDVRFPHLHRTLAKAGAKIIMAPAAFAATTGRLHWHVLLRARAIETGCFVVAPAQCGTHDGGRQTYGHSLIIAPSGEILAEAAESPCVILAQLDLAQVECARRTLPCLQHDCAFDTTEI